MPVHEERFSEVVKEHHLGLRYFIRSLGVQSAWVDDLAQETFLVAYRKWDEIDRPEGIGTWLRTIARNLVMNELSKSHRRRRLLDENLTTFLLQAEEARPAPGELGDAEHRREAIHRCLGKLSERSRTIIDMRYFQDRNATEIGEQLSMSSEAVRKVLFQSRRTLAICLAGCSVHEAR